MRPLMTSKQRSVLMREIITNNKQITQLWNLLMIYRIRSPLMREVIMKVLQLIRMSTMTFNLRLMLMRYLITAIAKDKLLIMPATLNTRHRVTLKAKLTITTKFLK